MTQQTKHSPTPWVTTAGGTCIKQKDGQYIADMRSGFHQEDNAEFIVSAVNAHSELIAALECGNVEKAHDELSDLLEDPDSGNDEIRDAAIFLCVELNEFYAKRNASLAKAGASQNDPA